LAIEESRNMAVPASGINRWDHYQDFFCWRIEELRRCGPRGLEVDYAQVLSSYQETPAWYKKLFFSAQVSGGQGWLPYQKIS